MQWTMFLLQTLVTKLIAIFYSFSKIFIFSSHAAILVDIFGFSSVDLLTGQPRPSLVLAWLSRRESRTTTVRRCFSFSVVTVHAPGLPSVWSSLYTCHVPTKHVPTTKRVDQARSQPSDDGGSFSSDFGPFSGFENRSSQWLSRGSLDFF